MTEANSKPKISFSENVGELASKYAFLRHKASIVFGKEGEDYKVKRDVTFSQIVDTSAEEIIQASNEKREGILKTTLSLIRKEQDNFAISEELEFIQRILLKTIEKMEVRTAPLNKK